MTIAKKLEELAWLSSTYEEYISKVNKEIPTNLVTSHIIDETWEESEADKKSMLEEKLWMEEQMARVEGYGE